LPERDEHRAGQRGDVDDDVGLQVAVGVGDRVGEHEPALGVGVEHLDGAPAVLRQDVAGRCAVPDGMFSAPRRSAVTRIGSRRSATARRWRARRGAAHVGLHVQHRRRSA
jgi:hypothetical protein